MESKAIAKIQSEEYDALVNAFGPENKIRFIQNFDRGSGNYTKDRKKISKIKL